MEKIKRTESFISKMVADYDDMTYSDLQGCVMAYCMESGDDQEKLLEAIEKRKNND